SAQIREILISESAWEEMTCLFAPSLAWLEQGLIDPEALITHAFEYQNIVDAIEIFEKDRKSCCKVLLTF
ncbi:hypothetical protein RZQ54_27000, partial [Raoultella planticola]|nr:hypothetical protein [Raoultella planticola]